MANDWKKRSTEEINKSVENGDFTGGYKFFPWLFRMQIGYFIGIMMNLIVGVAGIVTTYPNMIGLIAGSFFAGVAAPLFSFLTYKTYKKRKVGISS